MATVRELIVRDIVSALQQISVANGYATELGANVVRYRHGGHRFEDLPAGVVLIGGETFDDGEIHSELKSEMLIGVQVFCDEPTDGWADGSDAWSDLYLRDVHRAVMADPQRGGRAIDTKLIEWSRMVDQPAGWGFLLALEVSYYAGLEDPEA